MVWIAFFSFLLHWREMVSLFTVFIIFLLAYETAQNTNAWEVQGHGKEQKYNRIIITHTHTHTHTHTSTHTYAHIYTQTRNSYIVGVPHCSLYCQITPTRSIFTPTMLTELIPLLCFIVQWLPQTYNIFTFICTFAQPPPVTMPTNAPPPPPPPPPYQ